MTRIVKPMRSVEQRQLSLAELVEVSRQHIKLLTKHELRVARAKDLKSRFNQTQENLKEIIKELEEVINSGERSETVSGNQVFCTDTDSTWFETTEGELLWERPMSDKERQECAPKLFEHAETDEAELVASSGKSSYSNVRKISLSKELKHGIDQDTLKVMREEMSAKTKKDHTV